LTLGTQHRCSLCQTFCHRAFAQNVFCAWGVLYPQRSASCYSQASFRSWLKTTLPRRSLLSILFKKATPCPSPEGPHPLHACLSQFCVNGLLHVIYFILNLFSHSICELLKGSKDSYLIFSLLYPQHLRQDLPTYEPH
jgi:hypothetical protein